ncbi:hypothetical protein [Cohaesibacter celericrescens]|uniref:Uncharacterized protein n=1 Tax=Cohaesibacter celericrescens TaxID=2067669 RepID=A0A2N5XP25_9HYPH|nr:hypothetical protein [Cohaesibacter celericrescens]PLW76291.1 hypothetical protein C0081_15465 [Cohaesibacter celericrescens]
MTARKPTNRTKAASKAAKTIDLAAKDVTKRDTPEAAKDADAQAVSEPSPPTDVGAEPETSVPQSETDDTSQAAVPETDEAKSDTAKPDVAEADVSDVSESLAADTDTDEATVSEAPKPDNGVAAEDLPVASIVPPIAPAAEKKSGFSSGLVGGFLGGVAAVALSYVGLQQGMISLPSVDAQQSEQVSALSSLSSEVSSLSSEVTGLKTLIPETAPFDISPIETRITDIESQIMSIGDKIASLVTTSDTDVSADSVDANSPVALQLEALTSRFEGLKDQFDGLGDLRAQLETTQAKLVALETQASQQVVLIEQKAAEQAAQFEQGLAAAKDSILSSADRRINDVVTDLSNLDEKVRAETSALVGRVTSLEENNLSAKMQNSARTIALAGLENAVASGADYQLALTTFADVVGKHEAVELLAQYAQTGAPTKAQLARDYEAVYDKVLSEAESAGAATLMDKLLLNAQNLVRVRSLSGEKKGDSLTNKLGVIEFHVGQGDLATAAAEWDALPDAARDAKAGAEWLTGLKARIAVDTAMDTIRAEFGNGANGTAQ